MYGDKDDSRFPLNVLCPGPSDSGPDRQGRPLNYFRLLQATVYEFVAVPLWTAVYRYVLRPNLQ